MSGLIVRLGLVHFKRENLLGRELDVLNLSWAGQTFWRAFGGSGTGSALFRYLSDSLKRARRPAVEENKTSSFWLESLQAIWVDIRGFIRWLLGWYWVEIPQTLRRMSTAIWITLAIGAVAMLVAYFYVD